MIYVSATPGDFEAENSLQTVEQIIRPTGLLDPKIAVRPATGQVDDLIGEIKDTVDKGFRVLVTTLTKAMAERLTDFLRRRAPGSGICIPTLKPWKGWSCCGTCAWEPMTCWWGSTS